jgi:hypothetical protein
MLPWIRPRKMQEIIGSNYCNVAIQSFRSHVKIAFFVSWLGITRGPKTPRIFSEETIISKHAWENPAGNHGV